MLSRTLLAAGYDQSQADPCVTAFGTITTKSDNILEYLGMAVRKNDDQSITISQRPYFDKILAELDMCNCNPIRTPYSEHQSTLKTDKEFIDPKYYLKLVGMLNYPATLTRPDLLYAMSRLSQKCKSPTKGDLRRVIRVFKYIAGTKDLGITFTPGDGNIKLYGYVDASYQSYNNAASHYGYTFALNSKGKHKDASFYARSSKMKLVTLSSTEAEYVAAAEVTSEVLFLRALLADIGFPQHKPKVQFQQANSKNYDRHF